MDSETRSLARRVVMRAALGAALAAAAAVALAVATRGLRPDRALAFVLLVEALLAAIVAPLAAARSAESADERAPLAGALGAFAGFTLVLAVAALVRGVSVSALLLAQLYVLLHGAALHGVARSVASRRGPGAGLAAGLAVGFLLLGAPYFVGDLVGALPRGAEDTAVSALLLFSPSLALPGTFLERDPLRDTVLYARFAPVQDLAWSYASALSAIAAQALLAALAVGAGALASRLPRRTPAVALAVLLGAVLLAPAPAHAQIFGGGEGNPQTPDGEIGPMNTRVRLGYFVPFIDGNFKTTGYTPDIPPSRIDINNDLHFKLQYATPIFEVDVGWQGAGRVWVEYFELFYTGDFLSPSFQGVAFKNLVVPPQEIGLVDYRFRTISLNGRLDIPVLDWVTLQLIATTRYVHWNTVVRVPTTSQKDTTNIDYIFPCIGPGLDVFITDKIYVYGSVQWLDLQYDLFGKTHDVITHYREAHGGVRLELVEAAHVGVEFYLLEVGLSDSRHSYRQRMLGPRVWVEVQF